MKIFSIFVAFLENTNFTYNMKLQILNNQISHMIGYPTARNLLGTSKEPRDKVQLYPKGPIGKGYPYLSIGLLSWLNLSFQPFGTFDHLGNSGLQYPSQ